MSACFLGRHSSSAKSSAHVQLGALGRTEVLYILRFIPETDFDPEVCDFAKTNSSLRVGSETPERLPGEQALWHKGSSRSNQAAQLNSFCIKSFG
jgi:hypothetical protein